MSKNSISLKEVKLEMILNRFINESISTTILNFSQTYLYNNLERGLLEFVGPTTISKNTNNIAYSSNDIVKVLPQIFY